MCMNHHKTLTKHNLSAPDKNMNLFKQGITYKQVKIKCLSGKKLCSLNTKRLNSLNTQHWTVNSIIQYQTKKHKIFSVQQIIVNLFFLSSKKLKTSTENRNWNTKQVSVKDPESSDKEAPCSVSCCPHIRVTCFFTVSAVTVYFPTCFFNCYCHWF